MRSFLFLACLGLMITPAFGEIIVNGDFENSTFPYGWTDKDANNIAASHTGLTETGLDVAGSKAAYIDASVAGALYQSVGAGLDANNEWEMSLLFAAAEPASDRTLHFAINNVDDLSSGGIVLRINDSGMLQTLNTVAAAGATAWYDLTTVSFSTDNSNSGAGNDSFADTGDVLNVYALKIVGDYTTTTNSPSYDVYLSSANTADSLQLIAEDVNYFYSAAPTAGTTPGMIRFNNASTTGNASYVIDNVAIQSVPEPSTILMLLGGLASLVLARRQGA